MRLAAFVFAAFPFEGLSLLAALLAAPFFGAISLELLEPAPLVDFSPPPSAPPFAAFLQGFFLQVLPVLPFELPAHPFSSSLLSLDTFRKTLLSPFSLVALPD